MNCQFKYSTCDKVISKEVSYKGETFQLCEMHASWYTPEKLWKISIFEVLRDTPETPIVFSSPAEQKKTSWPNTLDEYSHFFGQRFRMTKGEKARGLTREQAFEERKAAALKFNLVRGN